MPVDSAIRPASISPIEVIQSIRLLIAFAT
jgi:hypothetical protein